MAWTSLGVTYLRILFPNPAIGHQRYPELKGREDVRFPWTHNREPDTFQFSKVLPSINHAAEPLWCAALAAFWFTDGSGGQSHFLRSCRNWFPARALESLQATAGIRENKRFRLLKLVARFCMAPIVFSPSNWLKRSMVSVDR